MAPLPRVSIVCGNASSNALGRALLIAELLRTETDVQIVGVRNRDVTWSPAASAGIPVHSFPVPASPTYYLKAISWLREVVADDLVITSKTLLQSLGLAAVSRVGRRGFVVDIDDWESGLRQKQSVEEHMTGLRQRIAVARSFAEWGGLNAFTAARCLEAYARRLPHRLVSNQWLRARFGGEVLYHVRDPAVLDPALPKTYPLPELPSGGVWVGFIGTPRAHKGVSVLIDAVERARHEADVGLVLMGVEEPDEPLLASARQRLGAERFATLPQFPLEAVRDHVRMVDIVALPSLDVPAAWGQIPAKLFDAMAMAKPVVATALNDMPEIVRGSGLIVPPGDVEELARALVTLAKDPDLRSRLGRHGREELIGKYGYDAGRRVLVRVVEAAARARR